MALNRSIFRDGQNELEDQLPMGSGSSTTANSDMKDVKEFIDKENSSHQVSNGLFSWTSLLKSSRFFHRKYSAWSEWAVFNPISFNDL